MYGTYRKTRQSVPVGLEKVLCRAAADPDFKRALLKDRAAAAKMAGYELLEVECTTLESVPDSTLSVMIDRIDLKRPNRRPFLRKVAACALAVAAGAMIVEVSGCSTGCMPDDYDYQTEKDTTSQSDAEGSDTQKKTPPLTN